MKASATMKLYSIVIFLLGQKQLVEEFNRLPVSIDTFRIRQKKEEIERQLTKVEEGIRVLSKPKVFVRIDDAAKVQDISDG